MTIAIACPCQDGVLFCADTKISTGYEQRHESKIFSHEWGHQNQGVSVFAVAGSLPYAIAAVERCEDALARLDFDRTSLDEMEAALDSAINAYYQSHIFPHPDRYSSGVAFDLLIGLWLHGHTRILATHQTALRRIRAYECIGVGGYLARYWLRQAFGSEQKYNADDLTLQEAVLVAECAMDNVMEYDEACGHEEGGGDAEYFMLRNDGAIGDLRTSVFLSTLEKHLQTASWALLKRLAKSTNAEDSNLALEEFFDSVRDDYESIALTTAALEKMNTSTNETEPD